MKRHRIVAIALGAALLAGCATTETHGGGQAANAAGDGYYVAAHDGYGDYWYNDPQVMANYGQWGFGYGYGWYGPGFSPWGFGYSPWFYGPPWWYWHHHHHHDGHVADVVAAAPGFHRNAAQQHDRPSQRAPDPAPPRHGPENRAPDHGFQHPRP